MNDDWDYLPYIASLTTYDEWHFTVMQFDGEQVAAECMVSWCMANV